MWTRSAPATASPGVAATCAPAASSARAFGFGAVPDRHRVAALQHALDHRAAQQPGSEKRHVRHVRASRYNLSRVRARFSLLPFAAILCGFVRFAVVSRSGAAGASLGGRSGRRRAVSSKPIPPDPINSSGSTSKSRTFSPPASAGRPGSSTSRFDSIDQSVARGDADIGMSGHRGHAGPARDDGGHAALLRVPRGAERPRRRRGALPDRSPTCAARRVAHARRHDRLRDPACAPSAISACAPCRTTTTCTRTAIW